MEDKPFTCDAGNFSTESPFKGFLGAIGSALDRRPTYYPLSAFLDYRIPHIVMVDRQPQVFWANPSPQQRLKRKIDYYSRLLTATEIDITFTENVLWFERGSFLLQQQAKKASTLHNLIDQLTTLQASPANSALLGNILRVEEQLAALSGTFTLHHEFGLAFGESLITYDLASRKKDIRIGRDLLMRGRMLRRFFRRVLRDIRKVSRTLLNTLFMHLNDQSEEDEILGQALPCFRPFIQSLQNWSPYGQTRNFSTYRTHYRQSGYPG